MTTHRLKIFVKYADAIMSGAKTFEIRKNDRDYEVGDKIVFNVVADDCHSVEEAARHPLNGVTCRIDYILDDFEGLAQKYVALAISKVDMTKRAMISQPMAGKTDEEIAEARGKANAKLREMGYEFVNTLFTDEWYSDEAMEERGVVQIPLCYLAKSLENMSLCHAAYFCKGWENARGCRIEHDAAVAYGLEVLYED